MPDNEFADYTPTFMKIKNRLFDVSTPTTDDEHIAELISIEIPMEWDDKIHTWLMTEEGLQKVEEPKARHMKAGLPKMSLRKNVNFTLSGSKGRFVKANIGILAGWRPAKGFPTGFFGDWRTVPSDLSADTSAGALA